MGKAARLGGHLNRGWLGWGCAPLRAIGVAKQSRRLSTQPVRSPLHSVQALCVAILAPVAPTCTRFPCSGLQMRSRGTAFVLGYWEWRGG